MKSHKKVVDTESIEVLKKLLAQKNRELEIEAALERVRNMTMAMHKTEGLIEVIQTVFMQFELLEVKADVCFINIHQADNNDWNLWVSTGAGQTYQFPVFPYLENPVFRLQLQARERGDTFYTSLTDKKSKDQFFDHFFKHLTGLDVPKARLDYIYKAEGIASSFTLSRHATIALANYSCLPYTEEENLILQRIGNVFEQTYNRFLDLKKAEDQTREAQVETALEKVRATSLSMRKTSDISGVVEVYFKQLRQLNIDFIQAWINVFHLDKGYFDIWFSPLDGVHKNVTHFQMPSALFEETTIKSWRKGEPFSTLSFNSESEVDSFLKACDEVTGSKYFSRAQDSYRFDRLEILDANYKYGAVSRTTRDSPTEQHKRIFQRFAKVFEQAYTRFLDLQKAEAQAREAEIQLALERVRARAMAMHKSEELANVSKVLYKELKHLGVTQSATCGFVIVDELNHTQHIYGTPAERNFLEYFKCPLSGDMILRNRYKAWKNKKPVFHQKVGGQKLQDHLSVVLPDEETSEVEKVAKMDMPDPTHFYLANFLHGYLQIIASDTLSDDQIKLLPRFAKVFEQAYTRFLDLQKAEAQAREAEIQLALERVRARTMAMHHSDELAETAVVLSEQLKDLRLMPENSRVFFSLIDEASDSAQVWMTTPKGDFRKGSHEIPLTQEKELARLYRLWKAKEPLVIRDLKGKKLEEYYTFLKTLPHVTNEAGFRQILDNPPKRFILTEAIHQFGTIGITSFQLLSEEAQDILVRFSKVFEQTYTRFLDLQKAEEQAREAEIQLALERVRARTMAMQHSEELSEAAFLLAHQVRELGIEAWGCAFHIYAEDPQGDYEWFSNEEGYLPFYKTPRKRFFRKFYEMRESGETLLVKEFKGKACENHYGYLLSLPVVGEALQEMRDSGKSLPSSQIDHVAYFKYGYLLFITYEPVPEAHDIFKRFAKEFEQTYTRFLDLQKAEAQAREAQIEAALERVRARSMSMHKSEELIETATLLYKELAGLGIPPISSGFVLVDENNSKQEVWFSAPGGVGYMDRFFLPLTGDSVLDKRYRNWKNKVPIFHEYVEGEKLIEHLNFVSSFFGTREAEEQAQKFPEAIVFYCGYFKEGYLHILTEDILTPEQESIMKRFTHVFAMTYTRFLDLKKAEAQAREAQIEAALERVRARTMAMHKSDDLLDSAALMFQQLQELGGNLFACGFVLVDKEKPDSELWMSAEGKFQPPITIPNATEPVTGNMFRAWEKGSELYVEEAGGEALAAHYDCLLSIPKTGDVFQGMLDAGIAFPTWQRWHAAYFIYGYLLIITTKPFEDTNLFVRFAKVFDQTYTRFLDLQKAEAQAREAQIEAALERVRARTMAMHKSEELSDTAAVMFQELKKLGINSLRSGVCIFNFNNNSAELWLATESGDKTEAKVLGTVTASLHPIYKQWIDAGRQKKQMVRFDLSGDELINYYKIANAHLNLPNRTDYAEHEVYYGFIFPGGSINVISLKPLTNEECEIGYRFANVFGLLYRRFQDLQKSEAQAREAQIEAALERIRARALAMQSSGDLIDVAQTLREQMGMLGQPDLESSIIHIYNEATNTFEAWYSFRPHKNPKGKFIKGAAVDVPIELTEWGKEAFLKYKSKETQYSIISDGEKLKEWYNKVLKVYAANTVEYDDRGKLIVPDTLHYYFSKFSGGALLMISDKEPNSESIELQARAAQVFNFAYQRFLDLKMAEGQAREAQIEVALERIRAKALAMQSSTDLHDVSIVLREQMGMLGQPDLESSIVHLYNNSESLESWYTFRSTETNSEKIVTDVAFIPVDSCEYIKETIEKYNSDKSEYTIVSTGKKLSEWYNVMVKVAPETIEYDAHGKMLIPEILYYHHSKFGGGALLLISTQPPSEESKELQRRAARVFNFAYQRFLDLKKAEEQAHEAKIEAALERVRAQTMAMQHSEDLSQSVTTTLDELEKLELRIQRCGVGIFTDQKTAQLWTTTHTDEGKQAVVLGELPLLTHPMMKGSYDAWLKKQGYSYVLEGEDLREYYEMIKKEGFELPSDNIEKAMSVERQFYNYFTFPAGGLYVFSIEPLSNAEGKIVQRFTDVFHLAFTRYLDLQNAEARAAEAIKQASLDRVRAEIASMRTSDDLQRITPLIWCELRALGVPFIRCGVFIMDNARSVIQSYLSTPDGKSLGVYDLPYAATEIAKKLVHRWNKKRAYKEHWDKDQFLKFMNAMAKRGLIQNQQVYQGDAKPPESLDLHFVPFKQGMLYAGNIAPLTEQELQLVKSLAEAFSIAYNRYEDFRLLEEAKNQTETAFAELKSTQNQLIHAEKMASLGELTAGIAHEIQNPLNFVNNFSEVSKELIEEMNDEIEAGNLEDVKEISEDVKQNLDKIKHHGQRASSIVKGMLEHSRTGKKEKELTDLNVLADEYLRLSYHGLRAKDKSFNADFSANLDPKLPKMKVIGQDIGRVLLNLINNAFYAVSSKSESMDEAYKPEVNLITKKSDKTVEIVIEDNGGGIPKDARDKIFQPFFTTKPTGQGTGLGLSLSYDIVTQGHDGHLEVETEEGIGTRFIIRLPIV